MHVYVAQCVLICISACVCVYVCVCMSECMWGAGCGGRSSSSWSKGKARSPGLTGGFDSMLCPRVCCGFVSVKGSML